MNCIPRGNRLLLCCRQ